MVVRYGIGFLIVNGSDVVEMPPVGVGVNTETSIVAPLSISLAWTVVVSHVGIKYRVVRDVPLNRMTDEVVKFVPKTSMMVVGHPAGTLGGEIDVTVGALIAKLIALDVPPPGAGFTTVIDPVPTLARSLAPIVA